MFICERRNIWNQLFVSTLRSLRNRAMQTQSEEKEGKNKDKCRNQWSWKEINNRKNYPSKATTRGLLWWHSGWESACQCRAHGFEPWSGKIPHTAERLGPWATITEPARLEPVLRDKRGRDNERPVHRDEEWPPLATTRESPRTEMKIQHSHK